MLDCLDECSNDLIEGKKNLFTELFSYCCSWRHVSLEKIGNRFLDVYFASIKANFVQKAIFTICASIKLSYAYFLSIEGSTIIQLGR